MTNIVSRRLNATLRVAILLQGALLLCGSLVAFAADSAAVKSKVLKSVDLPDSINLLVGFRPGAAYDLYARLTARYMLRYLPGHPGFVIENKPEVATETAKRIYQARPDGSTLAALIPALSRTVIGERRRRLRFGQAQLDRQSDEVALFALHALYRAVQNHA